MTPLSAWLLLLACAAAGHAAAAGPWMDRALPIPQRVAALLANLTRAEKIPETYATHTSSATARRFLQTGVGAVKYMHAFACPAGKPDGGIKSCVRQRNALQADFLASSKVPVSFINEGLHGGAPGGTIFPMPVNQGAAWNVSLVRAIGQTIAAEARAIGVDTVFAPVVNMFTDARFGRTQEGYSANPFITTKLGTAAVRGLQGDAPRGAYLGNASVASLGKHFAGYGAATGGLNGGPAAVSKRALFETFLRPWKSMAAAGLRSTMPAHNTVLDVPCHGNRYLLQTVFRERFGFADGVALSDCNDIGALVDFRLAANRSHAAAIALKAGVDWDLQCGPDAKEWAYNYLPQSFEEGLVTDEDLDKVVARVLTHKFAAGLFDDGPVDADAAEARLDTPAHRALAREAAEQSIVLLQNKGGDAVPLRGRGGRGLSVALLGPTASSDCQCDEATFSLTGSYALPGAHVVTLDEALRNASRDLIDSVAWAPGMASAGGAPGTGQDDAKLAAAVALANRSDVSILVLGDVQGKSNGGCGEWGDRDDLDLQGGQLELLRAVSAVASKTIVVLVHGRPQTFGPGNAALDGVDALFAAWRPGEEFGNAMVNLLSGKVSPSGKLAQSWPRSVGQVGGGSNPWRQRVRGKWLANGKGQPDPDGRRYDEYLSSQYASASPLFYFGFGLSYTTFAYQKLAVAAADNRNHRDDDANDGDDGGVLWTASVTVQNTGSVEAVEVVQLYVQDPVGLPFVPFWKRLVGFARVRLAPGEARTVAMPVLRDDVALYSNDAEPELTLYHGRYILTAGGASNAATLSAAVSV